MMDSNNIIQNQRNQNEQLVQNLSQTSIHSFIDQEEDKFISNPGYIDLIKNTSNIRILTLNPNSLRLSNDDKINMLIDPCNKYSIDAMILSETNIK